MRTHGQRALIPGSGERTQNHACTTLDHRDDVIRPDGRARFRHACGARPIARPQPATRTGHTDRVSSRSLNWSNPTSLVGAYLRNVGIKAIVDLWSRSPVVKIFILSLLGSLFVTTLAAAQERPGMPV